MTKKEKTQIDTFIMKVVKHKNRRLVDAKIFDKRSKMGNLVVLPIKDIIHEYSKLVKQVRSKGK